MGAFVTTGYVVLGPAFVDPVGPTDLLLLVLAGALAIARPAYVRAGNEVYAAGLVFLAMIVVSTIVRGGTIDRDLVLLIFAMTALYFGPTTTLAEVAMLAKITVGTFVVLSFVAWVAGVPDAASSYDSATAIAPIRVRGVFPHANSLAPAALTYLLLERVAPSAPWVRRLMMAQAGLLLLMAQSKSTWGAAIVAGVALATADTQRRRTAGILTVAALVIVTALAVSGLRPADVALPEEVENLTTLTGRTDLWQVGIERWARSDRIFGAGPDVFTAHAETTGQDWAGQAHNQFIQALAEQGLVGLALLLAYVAALLSVAWRLGPATRNASLAFVLALLVRTISETPLDDLGLSHVVTFGLLIAWSRGAAPAGRATILHPELATSR